MARIVIYGAGGFGREMLRFVRAETRKRADFAPPVFASDDESEVGGTVNGLPVISPAQFRADDLCVLAVGNGRARRRMADRCPGFIDLVSPTAIIDDGIAFRKGTIVCDYTIFTADEKTIIGKHFHANFKSHVGHDCVIGDFVTLAPSVCISGNVHIGDEVYLGTGAIIRHGTPDRPIRIGAGATIGMGAVVTKDVPAGVTVVGNPARILERPARKLASVR